jgi:hypothetical protein
VQAGGAQEEPQGGKMVVNLLAKFDTPGQKGLWIQWKPSCRQEELNKNLKVALRVELCAKFVVSCV